MRSSEQHLRRARERLNALHETIDALEQHLQKLRGATVKAEESLAKSIRDHVDAQTQAAIEKLTKE